MLIEQDADCIWHLRHALECPVRRYVLPAKNFVFQAWNFSPPARRRIWSLPRVSSSLLDTLEVPSLGGRDVWQPVKLGQIGSDSPGIPNEMDKLFRELWLYLLHCLSLSSKF